MADVVSSRRDIVLQKLAVREVPRSGPPKVLIEKYGIGTSSIVKACKDIAEA